MAKTTVKKLASDLPYNSDAERVVLGSALISNDALWKVMSGLTMDSFFEGRHQVLYRVLSNLIERKIPVEVYTVTEELINIKELDNVGGVNYLKECTDMMVALSSLDFYINIVKDQATLRNMLLTIRDIESRYRNEEIENVNEFIQQSQEQFQDAVKTRRVSEFQSAEQVAKEVKLKLDSQVGQVVGDVYGLSTGFDRLNEKTQGFQKGGLYIVAARPSVGKTALALNFAYRAATRANVSVAIFSLEMPSEQLVKRLIAAESYVNLKDIMSGNLNGGDKAKVAEAIRHVSAAPIFIDDSSSNTVLDIVAKCRKLQAEHPDLGLILIDYLGLVTGANGGKNQDSRQEEVRKISLALKGLARDLDIPVIALSQLSRKVEDRDTKRPMLSDLRDSGNIEQDADCVMLLYREDYYGKKGNDAALAGNKKGKDLQGGEAPALSRAQREKELTAQMPGDASYIEVNVAKNRNGQTGTVGLFFYKAYGRFDSPSQEWEEEMRKISERDID